jgi:hypothetical protein
MVTLTMRNMVVEQRFNSDGSVGLFFCLRGPHRVTDD